MKIQYAKILNLGGIGIFALAICLLLSVYSTLAAINLPVRSPQGETNEFVLDPGHSPNKPGAKSCSGTYEYI
jgi:hypothetical protein